MAHVAPMHAVWRIAIGAQDIRIASLDEDHIQALFESGRLKTAHVYRRDTGDKMVLLTAPTADVQQLLKTVLSDKDAFGDETVLTRK